MIFHGGLPGPPKSHEGIESLIYIGSYISLDIKYKVSLNRQLEGLIDKDSNDLKALLFTLFLKPNDSILHLLD